VSNAEEKSTTPNTEDRRGGGVRDEMRDDGWPTKTVEE